MCESLEKPFQPFCQMLLFSILWSMYLKYSHFCYFLFLSSELFQFSVLHAFNSVLLQRQFSTVNVPAPHSIWPCRPENTLQVAQTCYFAWLVTHMLSCFAAQPPPSEANLGQLRPTYNLPGTPSEVRRQRNWVVTTGLLFSVILGGVLTWEYLFPHGRMCVSLSSLNRCNIWQV